MIIVLTFDMYKNLKLTNYLSVIQSNNYSANKIQISGDTTKSLLYTET